MSIKKIKVASIWVDPEKEITAKSTGKKYKLADVSIKVADDCLDYAGRYIKGAFFEYNDPKDAKKNKTATERAERFQKDNDGKEILIDVTESEKKDKDGRPYLTFKVLTKAQREVASQFIK